jgi:hypothetical protein
MSHNNFFQTPSETSYGEITHANKRNVLNPLAHYCTCGGSVDTVITNNGSYQVRCSNCPSLGVAHKIKEVAIFNWNECKLSQFPARLTVLPFKLSSKAKYNPHALLEDAKQAFDCANDQINPIRLSALKYALKWATWFTKNNQFLSNSEMDVELQEFNSKFIALANSKMSVLQKRYLEVYKNNHKGLYEMVLYQSFLKLHCKDVLASILEEVTYPNRLIKAA